MNIVEFIEARLAEDEAAAEAVSPLHYTVDMGGTRRDEHFTHGRGGYASEDGMPRRLPDGGAAAHFARHDPARVLREVEAKRAILGAFHQERWLPEKIAAIYSDHPDYNKEW